MTRIVVRANESSSSSSNSNSNNNSSSSDHGWQRRAVAVSLADAVAASDGCVYIDEVIGVCLRNASVSAATVASPLHVLLGAVGVASREIAASCVDAPRFVDVERWQGAPLAASRRALYWRLSDAKGNASYVDARALCYALRFADGKTRLCTTTAYAGDDAASITSITPVSALGELGVPTLVVAQEQQRNVMKTEPTI